MWFLLSLKMSSNNPSLPISTCSPAIRRWSYVLSMFCSLHPESKLGLWLLSQGNIRRTILRPLSPGIKKTRNNNSSLLEPSHQVMGNPKQPPSYGEEAHVGDSRSPPPTALTELPTCKNQHCLARHVSIKPPKLMPHGREASHPC